MDEVFDWVVVGSGGGAMTSALQMASAGKTVAMLEKSEWIGGTTCKSGGTMWIPANRFMASGEDNYESAVAYHDAVVGDGTGFPGTSPERRRTYAREAPRMIDFLHDQGIALERGSRFWPDYYDNLESGCKTSRTVQALPFDKARLRQGAARCMGIQAAPRPYRAACQDGRRRQDTVYPAKLGDQTARGEDWTKDHSWQVDGKKWVTAGAALQGRLLEAALKVGVEIRTNSPVNELILETGPDGNDRVTGVGLTVNGRSKRIRARLGVLVNAGGFGKNQAMRDRFQPGALAAWSSEIESNAGDMHVEMERIGAVLAHMDEMVGLQCTPAPGWEDAYTPFGMQLVTAKPHAILVDQSGERYQNECGSYEPYCQTMRERNRDVPAIPSWAIRDAQYMQKYGLADRLLGGKVRPAWTESGWMKQATSIEGLANAIGIEPTALRRTVERWNGFVREGRDRDFHRGERAYDNYLGDPFFTDGPNNTMGTIQKAQFYAVPIMPGDVGTFGGAVTDIHARVLRADDAPIRGLYACGTSTASPMGGVYPGAGCSVGPSMTFGWIAARHALGET